MGENAQDRRALRSQRLLSSALVELLQEKRYADITVQDILDRADVGRSTFYAHYLDKEDLLIKSLTKVLEGSIHHFESGDGHALLSTVAFFRHVQGHVSLYRTILGGRGSDMLSEGVQRVIRERIARHFAALAGADRTGPVPGEVVAVFLAGSFMSLLKWWVENKLPYSPEQMDAMYQQLVMPGALAAAGLGLAEP